MVPISREEDQGEKRACPFSVNVINLRTVPLIQPFTTVNIYDAFSVSYKVALFYRSRGQFACHNVVVLTLPDVMLASCLFSLIDVLCLLVVSERCKLSGYVLVCAMFDVVYCSGSQSQCIASHHIICHHAFVSTCYYTVVYLAFCFSYH